MLKYVIAIAAGLSVSMALTGPVQALDAKERQALTLLLGAVTLGLIINDAKKNDRKSPQTTGYDNRYDYKHSKKYDRHNRIIPLQCTFTARDRGRRQDVVSPRCLAEFGFDRRLPRECTTEIRDRGRWQEVYSAECLTRRGYKIASDRR